MALMTTEKLPAGRLPRKVQYVLVLLRHADRPWDEIEIERRPLLDGHIFHIIARRHPGTLAMHSVQTALFYGKGRSGRLGRITYDSIGYSRTKEGWYWLRLMAKRSV